MWGLTCGILYPYLAVHNIWWQRRDISAWNFEPFPWRILVYHLVALLVMCTTLCCFGTEAFGEVCTFVDLCLYEY
jgi:hypothetical protein